MKKAVFVWSTLMMVFFFILTILPVKESYAFAGPEWKTSIVRCEWDGVECFADVTRCDSQETDGCCVSCQHPCDDVWKDCFE